MKIPVNSYGSPLILVKSIFSTIQCEGPFYGRAAVFIRLGACNLACPSCDTTFRDATEWLDEETIVRRAMEKMPAEKLVVITGGEPFAQGISKLVFELRQKGITVQIETNGTLDPGNLVHDRGVVIVCSPKRQFVHDSIAMYASAWKYVMRAGEVFCHDGLPSRCFSGIDREARPYRAPHSTRVYLQPIDDGDATKNQENLDACIDACNRFGYKLSVQVHKLIGLE